MNKKLSTITLILASIILVHSCAKKAKGEDKEIYDSLSLGSSWTHYKNDKTILEKSPASGHSAAKLLTRYNAEAAKYLDSNAKVIEGSVFSNGSIVVKDLYNKKDKLQGYAVMLKNSNSNNADKNGWVWAVFNEKGKVLHSSSKKGDGCTGCHAGGGNIDGALMNVSFP